MQRYLIEQKAAAVRLKHAQGLSCFGGREFLLLGPLQDLRCRVAIEQPAAELLELDADRACPEHFLQLDAVDQQTQTGIQLLAEFG